MTTYRTEATTVHHGDCLAVLARMPDNSVDAIVTDPPYGLGFMGEAWDDLPPGLPWAQECLRVLKPGGHLLAFGGTRTWHRLACAVEDAGFEMRDSIAWLYGSGFPKSLDVSKAIDKADGRSGAVTANSGNYKGGTSFGVGPASWMTADYVPTSHTPATEAAQQWQGWGTALKPAFEPVVVARKPLVGTVAQNVLAWGTGAINVDATRISGVPRTTHADGNKRTRNDGPTMREGFGVKTEPTPAPAGRWPANVVLDEDQAAALDQQSGETSYNPAGQFGTVRADYDGETIYGGGKGIGKAGRPVVGYGDRGGASRFFYVAKAPKSERPVVDGKGHPTVKPLTLMRWLVRLVTPPGGTVLDPFAGSGTTIEAAMLEGFPVVGIERDAEYLAHIEQRIIRARAAAGLL